MTSKPDGTPDQGQPNETPPTTDALIHKLPEFNEGATSRRYTLQDEIARGAMGVVVRGQDKLLNRELAVKVLLEGDTTDADAIKRFYEEAQINGQLQHPGIVPVYEVGTLPDNRPFFSMKLVKGKTLKNLLSERDSSRSDLTRFLGIFEQVCQTIAYSHSRRVIHRDLKPSNIMVGAFGEVQVMDWGIAKLIDDDAEPKSKPTKTSLDTKIRTIRSSGSSSAGPSQFQTRDGVVFGTLAYMSPEQALGEKNRVDERADVFGLGAILCEILTGEPPYEGENTQQLFRLAAQCRTDGVLQRLDESGADSELIELAKECLAMEAVDRPANATVVAERMSRYFESVDRRLRQAELSQTKSIEQKKRNKVMIAFAAMFLMLLSTVAVLWGWVQDQRSKVAKANLQVANAEVERQKELSAARETSREAAVQSQSRQLDLRRKAERAKSMTEQTLCDVYTSRGVQASETSDAGAAIMWFAAAAELAENGSQRHVNNLVRARNWTQNTSVPVNAFTVPGRPFELRFQPHGELILTRYTPLEYGFRDVPEPTMVFDTITEPKLSWIQEIEIPEFFNVKHAEYFTVFSCRNNQHIGWLPTEDVNTQVARGIPCWSDCGKWIAIASPDFEESSNEDWQIQVLSTSDGHCVASLSGLPEVNAIQFSPDGTKLGFAADKVYVVSVQEQIEIDPSFSWDRTAEILGINFSPDGEYIVAAGWDSVASVYSVVKPAGRPALQVPHLELCRLHLVHNRHAPVWVLRSNGSYAMASIVGPESLALWDVKSGTLIDRFKAGLGTVGKTYANKKGHMLVAGNNGIEIRDGSDVSGVLHSLTTAESVTSVRVSSCGEIALIGNFDATAQLYTYPDLRPLGASMIHDNVVAGVDIASDKRWLATTTQNGLVRVWTTPNQAGNSIVHRYAASRAPEVSADGRLMLSNKYEAHMCLALEQESVEVVGLMAGVPDVKQLKIDGVIKDSCWSEAVGQVLVASEKASGGLLSRFSAENHQLIGQIDLPHRPYWVEPNPVLPVVAVVGETGDLHLLDLESSEIRFSARVHVRPSWCAFLKFTPDGEKLVACDATHFWVWDVDSGQLCVERTEFPNTNKENCRVEISPDSSTLAIASSGSVLFWDLETGSPTGHELVHTQTSHFLGAVANMCFSPDSSKLLTCCLDRHARLWDWRTGKQVCPPMVHDSAVLCGAFLDDGKYVATGSDGENCGPHFWGLETGMKVAPSIDRISDNFKGILHLVLAPDKKSLVGCAQTAGDYVTFRAEFVELLEPSPLATDEFKVMGELTSSKQITLGRTDRLPRVYWLEKWQQYSSLRQRMAEPEKSRILR